MENLSSNYGNAAANKDILRNKIPGIMGPEDVTSEAEPTMELLFQEYISRKAQRLYSIDITSNGTGLTNINEFHIEEEDYTIFTAEYNSMISTGWIAEGKTYLKTDKFFQKFTRE